MQTRQVPEYVHETPVEDGRLPRRIDHFVPVPGEETHLHVHVWYGIDGHEYVCSCPVIALGVDSLGVTWALSAAGQWWRLHAVEKDNPNAVYVVREGCGPDEHSGNEVQL